jgi:hypothetical protein
MTARRPLFLARSPPMHRLLLLDSTPPSIISCSIYRPISPRMRMRSPEGIDARKTTKDEILPVQANFLVS